MAAEYRRHHEPPAPLEPTPRRVSRALTEVRTVHKRAATALATLRAPLPYYPDAKPGSTESKHVDTWDGTEIIARDSYTWRDPDADAIEAALEQVVALLAPFERGPKIKDKCAGCGEQYALTARGNITAHPDKVFYTAQCSGAGKEPDRG